MLWYMDVTPCLHCMHGPARKQSGVQTLGSHQGSVDVLSTKFLIKRYLGADDANMHGMAAGETR